MPFGCGRPLKTVFEYERAKGRAHILEGLAKALFRIDAVIKTIRASKSKEAAHQALMRRFRFSSLQAAAILAMPLSALARLERKRIEEELREKKTLMQELMGILKSPVKILSVMKKELRDLKERFADERKTRIFSRGLKEFSEADLVPKEDAMIFLTSDGYIKRMKPGNFKVQGRGGKWVIGLSLKEEDKTFIIKNNLGLLDTSYYEKDRIEIFEYFQKKFETLITSNSEIYNMKPIIFYINDRLTCNAF
ncbi:MAG: hypothetical protein IH961_07810, partial [Chloroflexi bacterium]|nr:hypothetical protein [Chloroflexota bacterium]